MYVLSAQAMYVVMTTKKLTNNKGEVSNGRGIKETWTFRGRWVHFEGK